MYRLLENKNHLIDRLNLTPEQKEEIKTFFLKHPSYESKIDWNNKSLQYKDFEPLLALDGKSKTQAKKNGLAGLIEGKDYVDFGEALIPELGKCRLYQPLTHLGSVILASNKVPPIKDNGAKWCISMTGDEEFWESYTLKDLKFLFIFTQSTKYALTVYPESLHYDNEIYTFEDKNIKWPSWCSDPYILKCIKNLREILKPTLDDLLEKYKGILVKNPDGTIDKVTKEKIPAEYFVKNGRFICQFNNWEGDFNCRGMQLISLIGGPKKVNGSFVCTGNLFTSLKGCPHEIKKSFYCHNNKLTSLKGCPKIIPGTFNCMNNNLTSLKGGPTKVGEDYFCQDNNLISLEGAPEEIKGNFMALDNQLISLEGSPKIIEGTFSCDSNKLESLKGAPLRVGRNFSCEENPSLTPISLNADNFSTKVRGKIICDPELEEVFKNKGYTIYKYYY